MSALAVTFTANSEHIIRLNYYVQLEKIQNLPNTWQGRDPSLVGKITIIKTLAISNEIGLSLYLASKPWQYILLKSEKVYFEIFME